MIPGTHHPEEPAPGARSISRVVSFKSCEIWFSEAHVVVDSQLPLPDLKLREFARPRVIFEGACYFVSAKSQSSDAPTIYRYVLSPWPTSDESVTHRVVLDEAYFLGLHAEQRTARWERFAYPALVLFYPFLGFLWSPQKRLLNRIGFESHSISGISTYTSFVLGFLCAVFLVIFQFGARVSPMLLVAGMILFLVDSVVRYDRLLAGKDQVPPGFYEWLILRRDRYE